MKQLPSKIAWAWIMTGGWAMAASLPHDPVPGGIARIELNVAATEPAPEVFYKGRRVLVWAHENQWHALVGLPLDTPPGRYGIQINGREIPFEIQDKHYPEQRLTISDQRKVDPLPQDLIRIEQEQRALREALASHSPEGPERLTMPLPTAGPQSSPFGLKRYFNGQARRPHAGMDIAAPIGSPVIAPLPGKVLAQGDYFFNGRTVLLDHGQGLISMYCHLDQVAVREGEQVMPGQQLGTVGKTGRVTGPHLHWGTALNGAWVNPELFTLKTEH